MGCVGGATRTSDRDQIFLVKGRWQGDDSSSVAASIR